MSKMSFRNETVLAKWVPGYLGLLIVDWISGLSRGCGCATFADFVAGKRG